ncbi:hypothetical protein CD29_10700 [Ureibacillus manganicus DSM 26584]|uniref:Uncharacterized protein n=1 Tax=Ureibacillus manganicus DSM 26584 TaxID=1384049 RepID=A0A0A3I716_9BACL|nr:hypothetical protein CD29_10700 [Ureibacillus manganicus DSM 26584]
MQQDVALLTAVGHVGDATKAFCDEQLLQHRSTTLRFHRRGAEQAFSAFLIKMDFFTNEKETRILTKCKS